MEKDAKENLPSIKTWIFPLLFNEKTPVAAQNLSIHPCQGMGLAKRDLGCSTFLLDAPPSVMALRLF